MTVRLRTFRWARDAREPVQRFWPAGVFLGPLHCTQCRNEFRPHDPFEMPVARVLGTGSCDGESEPPANRAVGPPRWLIAKVFGYRTRQRAVLTICSGAALECELIRNLYGRYRRVAVAESK